MTHYFFHNTGAGEYSVHKMDKDFEFLDTYDIILNEHHEVCNCPAYKTPCKHLRYVKEWLAQPIEVRHRMHFNDEAGKTGLWELPPEGIDPENFIDVEDASERYLDKTKGGP
jgi:hypothetical protein